MPPRLYLTDAQTQQLNLYQNGKCANYPNNSRECFYYFDVNIRKQYQCPMWILYNGTFDITSYEKDHIKEIAHVSGSNELSNWQLLCPSCHRFKTKIFTRQPTVNGKKEFTSDERGRGVASMEELNTIKKRKNRPFDKQINN
jgi:hypothetical protein